MRLPLKFTLALLPGIVIVLGTHTLQRLVREATFFQEDMAHDARMLSRVLGEAIAELLPTAGAERVQTLVRTLNRQSVLVRLRWLPPGSPEQQAAIAALPAEARRDLLDRGFGAYQQGSRLRPGPFFAYRRVGSGPAPMGLLEVKESAKVEQKYMRRTVRNLVVVTASSSILCAMLALGLGVIIVGRPMRALVERARRIGAGDFGGDLGVRQQDEIGDLAREIDQMSRRLAESRDRLAEEMAARVSATDQLRHADRLMTVGRLASGIAHELGTPLNIVSGRARMIEDGEVEGEELRKNARIIGEQSTRMARIIRQLLDFARQRGAQKGPSDLCHLVSQVAELLRPMADKANVAIVVDNAVAEAPLDVDQGQLVQALTNIAVNGIQAMPQGGRLTMRVERRHAQPPPGQPGEAGPHLAIAVRDTGVGMAADVREHLFEPFFTTKGVGEGTGLGLPVTHGIVQDHGGWIGVASEPGQGSELVIYLPERPAQAQA